MFVIGIPTLNEADNISRLVKQIDEYAVNLGKEIIIINSDSKSTDGTPQIFLETKTYNTKVSIVSEAKGKGYNVRNIFEYAINHVPNFSGLILIDGDVVSMKKMWLEKMFIAIESGNDLIIPNYARKSFEGNATNHFIYPMLVKFFKRDMPYQCISGDFGFSRGLIKDLTLKCNWHKYTLGYGIDIFLTLTAILKSYKIKEIDLQSKIHKKSFEKIEKIFLEVSQSFFETINDNSLNQDKLRLNINFESHSRQFIKSSDILSSNDIENLKLRALFLLQEEKQYPHGLSEVEWDGILSNTINNIYRYSSEEHSLLFLSLSGLMLMLAPPFYIMFHNAIILALSPALFSLFLSIFNIQFFSLVQKDVDNDFLGRVFGIIFTITILFMPIGTGFFSVALNPNNSFNLFIIGSCITILSLVFRILFKKYNIR